MTLPNSLPALWPASRLAEARAVVADVARHSDHLVGLACDVLVAHGQTERVLSRGKWRTIEVLACPVTWRPHPEQIASARRGYEDWWQALDWVRDGLVAGGMLREVEVTVAMPKARPWNRRSGLNPNQTLSNGI